LFLELTEFIKPLADNLLILGGLILLFLFAILGAIFFKVKRAIVSIIVVLFLLFIVLFWLYNYYL